MGNSTSSAHAAGGGTAKKVATTSFRLVPRPVDARALPLTERLHALMFPQGQEAIAGAVALEMATANDDFFSPYLLELVDLHAYVDANWQRGPLSVERMLSYLGRSQPSHYVSVLEDIVLRYWHQDWPTAKSARDLQRLFFKHALILTCLHATLEALSDLFREESVNLPPQHPRAGSTLLLENWPAYLAERYALHKALLDCWAPYTEPAQGSRRSALTLFPSELSMSMLFSPSESSVLYDFCRQHRPTDCESMVDYFCRFLEQTTPSASSSIEGLEGLGIKLGDFPQESKLLGCVNVALGRAHLPQDPQRSLDLLSGQREDLWDLYRLFSAHPRQQLIVAKRLLDGRPQSGSLSVPSTALSSVPSPLSSSSSSGSAAMPSPKTTTEQLVGKLSLSEEGNDNDERYERAVELLVRHYAAADDPSLAVHYALKCGRKTEWLEHICRTAEETTLTAPFPDCHALDPVLEGQGRWSVLIQSCLNRQDYQRATQLALAHAPKDGDLLERLQSLQPLLPPPTRQDQALQRALLLLQIQQADPQGSEIAEDLLLDKLLRGHKYALAFAWIDAQSQDMGTSRRLAMLETFFGALAGEYRRCATDRAYIPPWLPRSILVHQDVSLGVYQCLMHDYLLERTAPGEHALIMPAIHRAVLDVDQEPVDLPGDFYHQWARTDINGLLRHVGSAETRNYYAAWAIQATPAVERPKPSLLPSLAPSSLPSS